MNFSGRAAGRNWSCRELVCVGLMLALGHDTARADAFDNYVLARTFELPGGAGAMDALSCGRVITLVGGEVYVETTPRSGVFSLHGLLPDASLPSYGAAFLRVSPDGTSIAVGNNGGDENMPPDFKVGIFDVESLSGTWFAAEHFDAEWADDTHLAITAGDFVEPGFVTVLDTTSSNPAEPTNPVIVNNIGGASGGITFDHAGNLYTGNGFSLSGPSGTGAVMAFENAEWMAALSGGGVLNFESDGTLVVDILSASPLAFDVQENLSVGGGDLFGSGEGDFVALVRSSAIAQALSGAGPADPDDSSKVRRLDPDTASSSNFYTTAYNPATGELYVRDFGDSTVYVFVDATGIPATSEWGMAVLTLFITTAAQVVLWRRARAPHPIEDTPPCVWRSSKTSPPLSTLPLFLLILPANPVLGDSPFASRIVDYSPAPGQFVNNNDFNDPEAALEAPLGAGTAQMNTLSIVSLGGFGGSITLAFDHVVEDGLLNPLGLDAIVFGNAIWVGGNPNAHWAECATIEIALDANKNGRVDTGEEWYLIPGSHMQDPTGKLATQIWDDNPNTPTPPELLSWIPAGRTGTWSTSAYALPDDPFASLIIHNPSAAEDSEGIYGYAEYTPTLLLGDMDGDNVADEPSMRPEEFYTVPDDPLAVGVSPGCGGGDAFDIAWAVDPETGLPARLAGFDFIRLTNGVNALVGIFGEKSPEIDALADVRPDPFGDVDLDSDIDLADSALFQQCFGRRLQAGDVCYLANRNGDVWIDALDAAAFVRRLTGPR